MHPCTVKGVSEAQPLESPVPSRTPQSEINAINALRLASPPAGQQVTAHVTPAAAAAATAAQTHAQQQAGTSQTPQPLKDPTTHPLGPASQPADPAPAQTSSAALETSDGAVSEGGRTIGGVVAGAASGVRVIRGDELMDALGGLDGGGSGSSSSSGGSSSALGESSLSLPQRREEPSNGGPVRRRGSYIPLSVARAADLRQAEFLQQLQVGGTLLQSPFPDFRTIRHDVISCFTPPGKGGTGALGQRVQVGHFLFLHSQGKTSFQKAVGSQVCSAHFLGPLTHLYVMHEHLDLMSLPGDAAFHELLKLHRHNHFSRINCVLCAMRAWLPDDWAQLGQFDLMSVAPTNLGLL